MTESKVKDVSGRKHISEVIDTTKRKRKIEDNIEFKNELIIEKRKEDEKCTPNGKIECLQEVIE